MPQNSSIAKKPRLMLWQNTPAVASTSAVAAAAWATSSAAGLFHAEHALEGLAHLVTIINLGKGVLTQAVPQAQGNDAVDVLGGDLAAALEGSQGLGSTVGHDVTADSVHVELAADLADLDAVVVVDLGSLEQLARLNDAGGQGVLLLLVLGPEGGWVLIKDLALRHNLHTQLRLLDSADLGVHAEAIQQLGAQLTLLGVTGAHQDEAGRVADGDTLTLHSVPAGGGRVQQHVHQVVVQQVDLVHVQDAAVGLGQQAGLKGLHTLSQSLLNVNGTAHTVLSGTQGQLDQGSLGLSNWQLLAIPVAHQGIWAHELGIIGI
mmetsp:Transcript_5543/g.12269  ORF Transcript_5543/g.12269 Transcript_5543/m.12269 type:complete len:319 (+) Transcript_5543:639-1595(+)